MAIFRISASCAVAGAAVLLAACGSSGHAGSTPTSTGSGSSITGSFPVAHSSAPVASPSASAASAAQLKDIVLRAGDLPGAWKGTPAQQDGSASDEAALLSCIGTGRKNTDSDKAATVDSLDYTLGNAAVSSSASSYRSQSDVDSDKALLANPKLTTCFKTLVSKELAASAPKGATVGPVSVTFTPGPGSYPSNVAGAGSVNVQLTANGQQVPLFIDFVYLTGPMIEAEVDAENTGAPVPPAVLKAAVTAVANRAAKAG